MNPPKHFTLDWRGGKYYCLRKRQLSLTIPKEFLLDGNKVMDQLMVFIDVNIGLAKLDRVRKSLDWY